MNDKHYEDLESVFQSLAGFLKSYGKSRVLQNYGREIFVSLFYGNLILNFFNNLKQHNVRELELPPGKIGVIKKHFNEILKNARSAVAIRGKKIDRRYYIAFRSRLRKDFPEFLKLAEEVEKAIDLKKTQDYLTAKSRQLSRLGKTNPSILESISTALLEALIGKEGKLPTVEELQTATRATLSRDFFQEMTKPILTELERTIPEMSAEEDAQHTAFEARLYGRWRKPLDLLQCLIKVSLESGQDKATSLAESSKGAGDYRLSALVQIHARAIQIGREVLTLLYSGYADGAFARWRSLHELATVVFFLHANGDDVARRFLEHDVMKRFKEAKEYRRFYKRLGYPPFGRHEYQALKKKHDALLNQYGSEFEYKTGYEWIPLGTVRQRTLRGLEEQVKLSHWRPHYVMSSNAVHGGPRGFFRFGLIDQDTVLLAGPSNYGLADPLQMSAISLTQISVCLLNTYPRLEDLLAMLIHQHYVEQIGSSSVDVQRRIEREEERKARRRRNRR